MKRWNWRPITAFALVVLFVPFLTQWAFKINAHAPFFVAVWTAGEFLDYAGSIIGAVATIAAVRMTIQLEREERFDEHRLNVLPLIAITTLERHVPRLDLFSDCVNQPEQDEGVIDIYKEYSPDRGYIVVDKSGEIAYLSDLSEEQARYKTRHTIVRSYCVARATDRRLIRRLECRRMV